MKDETAIFVLNTRPLCGTCAHFHLDDAAGRGHCRIRSPKTFKMLKPMPAKAGSAIVQPGQPPVMIMQEELSSSWSPIMATSYCGEHPDFAAWYTQNKKAIRAALTGGAEPIAKAS